MTHRVSGDTRFLAILGGLFVGLLVAGYLTPMVARGYYCTDPARGTYQNCWRDDKADPTGTATCDSLGGFCRNRMCICGVTDPGVCPWIHPGDSCATRGLTCPSGVCTTVHVTDCRCIAGYPGGCISYCQADLCVPNKGAACSACNACGMCNSGTIACGGTCSATAPSNALCGVEPIGSLDAASCSAISGWALDQDYAGSINVSIYDGASLITTVLANASRPDVGLLYPGHTLSGYSIPFPAALKNGAAHTIHVYGINVNSSGSPSGANPELGGSPKTVTCSDPPSGAFLTAACSTAADGTVTVTLTGNASDNQSVTGVPIQIYDGATLLATGTASQTTTDFSITKTGGTGFLAPLTGSSPRTTTLTAYAKDIPTGVNYQLPPSLTVTCYPPPPSVTISASPAPVPFAATSTVTWNSPNAASCSATGGDASWPRTRPPTGSYSSAALTAPTTFTVACSNAGGTGPAASVVVVVQTPPPPVLTGIGANPADFCAASSATQPPKYSVSWNASSTGLTGYEVELHDLLGTRLFTVADSVPAVIATIPGTQLSYDSTYNVRVRVDSAAGKSNWSSDFTFSTPSGPAPIPANPPFTWSPTDVFAGIPVTFTDGTTIGAPISWLWTIASVPAGTFSATVTGNPSGPVTFPAEGSFTAQLDASNATGTCTSTLNLTAGKALPIYKEVLPGSRPSPTP